MADAVAEKPKIKDDEFDIHGDLAVSESDDKSFVVLYDSSKEASGAQAPKPGSHDPADQGARHNGTNPPAPTLEDMNESQVMAPQEDAHAGDAYIDDILSSDDIDNEPMAAPVHATQSAQAPQQSLEDDDGPISLSSEELDGILEMGPATEEEFHPDFPVDTDVSGHASPRTDGSMTVDTDVSGSARTGMSGSGTVDTDVVAHAPASQTTGREGGQEDDDLPIALSDEDLDEILLEEEGGAVPSGDHHAPPPAMPAHEEITPPPMDVDQSFEQPFEPHAPAEAPIDEEPIALSDDELDHILADAEAGHHEGHATHGGELSADAEDEVLTLDDEPELTMIDDGSPTDSAAHTSHESNDSSSFFDSDEDEPITLSDEELDGILSTAPEEDAPQQTDEVKLAELPDDGIIDVHDEAPAHGGAADDEPIALSADELDGILMDADEPQEGLAELPPEAQAEEPHATEKSFFDSDDDEPIALSADELDGIAATATTEDVPHEAPTAPQNDLADLPPEAMEGEADASAGTPDGIAGVMDERYADVDHMDTSAPAGEDEGPISLSSDELDGIVADSHEVTPEAPMVGLSPHDTGHDAQSLAENTEKPATVFEEDLEAATLIHEDDAAEAKAGAAANAPETEELKSVMGYLDNLLGELPDDVIEKFAQSDYFKLYQKIMDKLGL